MKLSDVRSSRGVQPIRTLIYGPEKVGKTTEAAKAEAVIAIDVEGRMGHIDVMKFPMVTSWKEILDCLDVLAKEKHSYKNVMIDSVSAAEKLLKLAVQEESGWNAIEADEFGRWQKIAASSYWPELFRKLERLERERGMGVVMTAHLAVKSMKNPSGEPYDRFRPALGGEQGPALFLHWCHDVLYANFQDMIRLEKSGGRSRVRTSTSGDRVIRTRHAPAYDAGNSCGLPDPMAFDWVEYIRLRNEGLMGVEDTLKQIRETVVQITDEKVKAQIIAFVTENKTDLGQIRKVAARIHEILAEQQQKATEAPAEGAAK